MKEWIGLHYQSAGGTNNEASYITHIYSYITYI